MKKMRWRMKNLKKTISRIYKGYTDLVAILAMFIGAVLFSYGVILTFAPSLCQWECYLSVDPLYSPQMSYSDMEEHKKTACAYKRFKKRLKRLK